MSEKDTAQTGPFIQRLAEFRRPTALGEFNVISYNKNSTICFAITKGTFPQKDLLVRVQSPCLFSESFGVNSCDCGAQLTKALEIGSKEPNFLLVYLLDQEGRGLGMLQKIKAIEVEAKHGVDMAEAFRILGLPIDVRDYGMAVDIIRDVNSDQPIRLLTNNPKKEKGLKERGANISATERLLIDPPNSACQNYLSTKKNKLGHILPHVD